jgi:hypothetical protein
MSDLKDQLTEGVAPATWEFLVPHVKRDAVIIVDDSLDLVEVGNAIAQDNTTAVQSWIKTEQLTKPSADQLATWNQDLTRKFTALIVQPFVLIQI